jgi:3-oxoacyl-[acyl-carrier protein] reductase
LKETVLVTGAARGIGRETARLFAEAGWRVAIGYNRSEAAARALLTELSEKGADCVLARADVSDPRQAEKMFETAGGADVLINNAGTALFKPFGDTTDADWRACAGANLDGVFYCCRAALPYMLQKKRGAIVNVASVWGQTGASCEVAYSAAKAGVIGLTRALAKELGPSGIRVNCVAPGVIDTDMTADLDGATRAELAAQTPLCRIGTPLEAARAVFFLASEAASFVTGQVLAPNGGFYA